MFLSGAHRLMLTAGLGVALVASNLACSQATARAPAGSATGIEVFEGSCSEAGKLLRDGDPLIDGLLEVGTCGG
ncbi:MAG: hypothetical protein HY288_06780 [Planctomycetia bacterium]|nr:hypothetical protein [Planctomycetia bacterium]